MVICANYHNIYVQTATLFKINIFQTLCYDFEYGHSWKWLSMFRSGVSLRGTVWHLVNVGKINDDDSTCNNVITFSMIIF